MWLKWRAALLVAILLPINLAGQEVASSLDEVLHADLLTPGDAVHVTVGTGARIKGYVTEVSAAAIVVDEGVAGVGPWNFISGGTTWNLMDEEIVKIERQDPIWPSVLLGVGIAATAVAAICRSHERLEWLAPEQCVYIVWNYGFPAMGLLGVLGGYIDASMHKVLYESPGSIRVSWAPSVSAERVAARMAVGW